ncbi:hypothetical protein C8T65DRAFT_745263 [Cerioporus squamosus]|nr:hypothetical protein C8T65DRAFT_745263 [Cerioporus squamosus]
MLAERHGYKWIWNDASCIDKSSSAELSEAINSMFSYYAHSEMCYAFLADVPEEGAFDVHGSGSRNTPFAASRWFQRGWTLQELIAPAQVVFLSSSWSVLGTKAMHAALLSAVTNIPRTVLTFEEEIWDVSIADRMSWASGRKTTRMEDEAYSLMGIFDVHMPTMYGEGRNAFRRLQEDLMRKRIDATLFAWGESPSDHLPRKANLMPFDDRHDAREMYLFATSPSDFSHWARYAPRMAQTSAKIPASPLRRAAMSLSNLRAPPPGIPSFEITPYGVRARMRVFKIHGVHIADLHISYNMNPTIVEGDPVGLLLGRSVVGEDPTGPLYHPCVAMVVGHMERLVNIGEIIRRLPNLADRRRLRRLFDGAPWLEFYLTHVPPKPLLAVDRSIMNRGTTNLFHVPAWLLAQLQAANLHPVILSETEFQGSWDGDPPVRLVIYRQSASSGTVVLSISFGRCPVRKAGKLWVDVDCFQTNKQQRLCQSHSCSISHHFDMGLPVYTREFTNYSHNGHTMKVTPVFTAMPHPLSPTHIYVLTELKWIEQIDTSTGGRTQRLVVSASPVLER